MKKLLYSSLTALMMLFSFVGVVRAEGESGEGDAPAAKPKVAIALSATTWDGTTAADLPKFTVTVPDGITLGNATGNVAVKVNFFKMDAYPEVDFDQFIEAAGETAIDNTDGKLTEGVWMLSYYLVKGDDHTAIFEDAEVEVAEAHMMLTVGDVASVTATITIMPAKWTIGSEDGIMYSCALSSETMSMGTEESNVALLVTFTQGETVKNLLITEGYGEFDPTEVGLTAGEWALSYKFGKGNSTVANFVELEDIAVAEGAPATLTIREVGRFTITPAPTETAMAAGTKLTLAYSDATLDVYYGMFADVETAKSAVFGEGDAFGVYMAPNFVPVLTAAKPVIRVLAVDDATEEVIADSIVVYVVEAAPVEPATPIAVTFKPASGSTVAPGTKISVEIAELGEGEELNYKWFETKEAAEAAEWAQDWDDDELEAYLERGLDKDTLYLKVALVEVDEEWNGTVKGYSEVATYIIDKELIDKIIVTPATGTLVRENDSVSIEVKFGGEATEGTLVYKMYASINDANDDMDLLGTAQTYNAALKPVITRANPVLAAGYKNAEGWVIEPVTVEYFFDPDVTSFAVAAAGKNTMKENTVEFDGIASFTMKADGDVIKGLQIAAKIYSKDYKDTITTYSYEATDTEAEFIGIYNGEYVVNFSLRHAYAAGKDSVIADTTIFFNVTNYEEPAPDNYKVTIKPVGAEITNPDGAEITNLTATYTGNVVFDIFVEGLTEKDNMKLSTTIYEMVQYTDTVKVEPMSVVDAKDSVRFDEKINKGSYVAVVDLKRVGQREEDIIVEFATLYFNVKGELAIEAAELAGVNVYPNPNAGTFNVAVPERARIDIFGLNGAKVLSREVNAGVEAFNINHSGIYFVRVMAGNKTAVKRVVVR